jgi:hypothetical protein
MRTSSVVIITLVISVVSAYAIGQSRLEAPFFEHRQKIAKLLLPGTQEKVAKAVFEMDARLLGAKTPVAISKLSKSVAGKFKNLSPKQSSALQYYLLVETLKHLLADIAQIDSKNENLDKLRLEYNEHIAELKKRNPDSKKKAKAERGQRAGTISDPDFVVLTEETEFLKFELPKVSPAPLKQVTTIVEKELSREIEMIATREKMIRQAIKNAAKVKKQAMGFHRNLVGALKKTHRAQADDLVSTSQF